MSGATVSYGYRPFGEIDTQVQKIGQPALSGKDGSFKISILKTIMEDWRRYPGQIIFASATGYIGSDIISPSDNGRIALYHPSELNLHVTNDTVKNQIDEIKVWLTGGNSELWGYPGFIGRVVQGWYPYYISTCKGRDFDSIFVIKNLWGNVDYSIGGGSYSPGPPLFSYGIYLPPDSVYHMDVSF